VGPGTLPGDMSAPQYAGLVSRGVAFAVDAVVTAVVAVVCFTVLRTTFAAVGVSLSPDGRGGALAFLLSFPVVFAAYSATCWALVGRTPGMLVSGVRVVAETGDPPGARRSVVRALGYWVSSVFFVGFAWIAVDRRRQGFHDKLAGTFVVYDWEPASSARTPPAARTGGARTP
jgi:uncharacterized RDD family membrane protein YckC